MKAYIKLYSNYKNEISNFLNLFYNKSPKDILNLEDNSILEWQKDYENPIEIADIIGIFIENNDKFKINMWISLDKGVLINITNTNADQIIRYLFERYPY